VGMSIHTHTHTHTHIYIYISGSPDLCPQERLARDSLHGPAQGIPLSGSG